jgi:hypothetical protein
MDIFNEQSDTVAALHPDYAKAQRERQIWQDVADGGTLVLREKCKTYLPQFPREKDPSYKYRCDTATLFNLPRKTRDVMTGLVFQDAITLGEDVAPEIVELWENIDNQGTHGDVFCRERFKASFEGFAAVLVDSPNTDAQTLEDERSMGLRPYWIGYAADQIVNWRYRINPASKAKELEMIVLKEVTLEPKGRFRHESVTRYRAFYLDGFMVTWELWRDKGNSVKTEDRYTLEATGSLPELSQIPVGVIGCLGERPPFNDIALKTVEHFQTYSDYKSIIHKTCVPFPVRKGFNGDGNADAVNDEIIDVPVDGDFGFAEVTGASIEAVRNSLIDIREDVSLMGLSILADKTAKVDMTATEALLNNIGETAEIRVMARALQDCIELCLGFTAEYLGMDKDKGGSVTLGTSWNKAEIGRDTPASMLPADADLNAVLDAINKAEGLVPLEDRLKWLYPNATPEEIAAYAAQVAKEQAVRDQWEMERG